jgi:hypothetical protein
MDPYPQINDVDTFSFRQEFCEDCAGGRPICAEPCEDATEVINEMKAEFEAELAFESRS